MAKREWAECLRELHDATHLMESSAFRRWALQRIGAVVPFAEASWTVDGDGAAQVVSTGGSASGPAAVTGATTQRHAHVESADTQTTRARILFSRTPPAHFTQDERELLDLLASQALQAWRTGQKIALLRHLAHPKVVAATADPGGAIHALYGDFHGAARACWPDWRGRVLPDALRALRTPGATLRVRDHHWSVQALGSLLLIMARSMATLSALSARERAIAVAVLEAGSQREAAARLRISSHTVRNTLARIYAKLGVRNRVELALRYRSELLLGAAERLTSPSSPAAARHAPTAIGA